MSLELDQLQQQVRELHSRLELSETRSRRERRRLRFQGSLAFAALVGAIVVSPGNRAAIAQGYGVTLQQLATRISAAEANITALQGRSTALETKTQFITADKNAKTTTFTGCNVYIQNGLGATNGSSGDPLNNIGGGATNGLGNLVIGYNYAGRGHTDPNTGQFVSDNVRTGSHNLVLGDMNNYSSYGGIVAGYFNTLSGPLATITGGDFNTTSGVFSAISGGVGNTVSATSASVSGGQLNTVNSVAASISGGYNNTASGYAASVSGGQRNTASQNFAAVSGGLGLTQSNFYGWSAGSQGGPSVNANFTSQ